MPSKGLTSAIQGRLTGPESPAGTAFRLTVGWLAISAIDMAGAAGRKVAEPSDLLIALLLNESSSASLALERLRQGMAVEVLEMAKRLSDLPAGVLEKCWSESESQEMVRVRESPRPTTSR